MVTGLRRSLRFFASIFRRFGLPASLAAETSLKSQLNNNFGCIMKSYWTLQREELEKQFRENPSEA